MREPADELRQLEKAGLRRTLRRIGSAQGTMIHLDGREVINFSSNDYLGLADSSELKAAYRKHLETWGVGSGASRLVCGTMEPHLRLERAIARFKSSEAALTFATGFATAMGTIGAICGKGDIIILDKLCHASLIDGARMSGATIRVFPHNQLEAMSRHLEWAAEQVAEGGRILVVTESVFSMDGDRAPLRDLVGILKRYDALLLVDEAHAFGTLGPGGRGLVCELGLSEAVDFQMGTFSKAMGLSGGYVAASQDWIDLLINKARSFIYSTAPAPALAATIHDALDLMSGPEGDAAREALGENIETLGRGCSSIAPIIMGENDAALAASDALLESGFLAPAIRFPTVPRGTARLRVTLSAKHTTDQISSLKTELARFTGKI